MTHQQTSLKAPRLFSLGRLALGLLLRVSRA